MRAFGVVGVLVGIVYAGVVLSGQTQPSRCADCHFANPQSAFNSHVSDWDLSAHSRNRVGCDSCHNGDPSTFEAAMAHRGVIAPANAKSPVSRFNVVRTCGGCHAGQFVAFQKSHHFEMLEKGDAQVPTCVTCHEEAGSRLLSPKALEGQCARCHGTRGFAPRANRPQQARTMMEGVRDVRLLLNEAKRLIRDVRDKARRARFEAAAQQAEVPLIQAIQAGHSFVYDELQERLDAAQRRVALLRAELANPPQK